MKKVFAAKDIKSNCFLPPVTDENAVTFSRGIAASLRKYPESPLASFPQDFQLYELAQFNEQTGEFEPNVQPRLICDLNSLLSVEQKNALDSKMKGGLHAKQESLV
jgi:hypothetical protein